MSASLNNDDRCAVDLLLENVQRPAQGSISCFTQSASSDMQKRLAKVEEILHLLDEHVAPEPAKDLAARTVARCLRPTLPPQPAQTQPIANA
jgi:hypothetical protein